MSGSGDERDSRLQRSIAHLFEGEDDDDTFEPAIELDEHSDGDAYTG